MRELAMPYDMVVIDGGMLPHGRLLSAWSAVATETAIVARTGLSRKAAIAEAFSTAASLPGERTRTILIA